MFWKFGAIPIKIGSFPDKNHLKCPVGASNYYFNSWAHAMFTLKLYRGIWKHSSKCFSWPDQLSGTWGSWPSPWGAAPPASGRRAGRTTWPRWSRRAGGRAPGGGALWTPGHGPRTAPTGSGTQSWRRRCCGKRCWWCSEEWQERCREQAWGRSSPPEERCRRGAGWWWGPTHLGMVALVITLPRWQGQSQKFCKLSGQQVLRGKTFRARKKCVN